MTRSARPPMPRVGAFRPVRRGDRVAVIAPSSPIKPELLEAGLQEVRRLGYEPVTRDDIADAWRFCAGTDERRLEEITQALADPGIAAIWLARGGHGATPLLARLDPQAWAARAKPIIGESDATALGCWALAQGVAWLHGPMVATALRQGAAAYDEASLVAAMSCEPFTLAPRAVRTLRAGEAEGVLWGGCLSLLSALAGTPWLSAPERGVLVVEDIGVKPYQVHRMLTQLRDAGLLEGLCGVVLGDFSGSVQHPDQGYDIADVLAEFFAGAAAGVPVTLGWPIGHAPAPHLTLPMGWRARLQCDADGARLHVQPPS